MAPLSASAPYVTEYVVGPLRPLRGHWRAVPPRTALRFAAVGLRHQLRYVARQWAAGNRRAVRSAVLRPFRCELAGSWPLCGTGWSARGARADLARRLLDPPWDADRS